jgi:hypothetical protein
MFGVFVWNNDTHYYVRENAVSVHKTEKSAEKAADKLNAECWVYVVRPI